MHSQHTPRHRKSTSERLERARAIVERAAEPLPLAVLANTVGLSPSWLQRSFRRRFGLSPAEYARARRFAALKHALRRGAGVAEAVYAAGFGSGSRVYEHTDRLLGMSPGRYRRGGAGVTIRYTTVASPLGRVLVAATPRGVCAVTLADTDAALTAALRAEFPTAGIVRIDAGRDAWLGAVIARIGQQLRTRSSPGDAPPLPPLDVTATAFQWRVWQALTRIPAGATRTYGEVARAIGEPGAARAVGRACGANRLALIVPCHRVVRADGSPGGWRWGAARKRMLLQSERDGTRAPHSRTAVGGEPPGVTVHARPRSPADAPRARRETGPR